MFQYFFILPSILFVSVMAFASVEMSYCRQITSKLVQKPVYDAALNLEDWSAHQKNADILKQNINAQIDIINHDGNYPEFLDPFLATKDTRVAFSKPDQTFNVSIESSMEGRPAYQIQFTGDDPKVMTIKGSDFKAEFAIVNHICVPLDVKISSKPNPADFHLSDCADLTGPVVSLIKTNSKKTVCAQATHPEYKNLASKIIADLFLYESFRKKDSAGELDLTNKKSRFEKRLFF